MIAELWCLQDEKSEWQNSKGENADDVTAVVLVPSEDGLLLRLLLPHHSLCIGSLSHFLLWRVEPCPRCRVTAKVNVGKAGIK